MAQTLRGAHARGCIPMFSMSSTSNGPGLEGRVHPWQAPAPEQAAPLAQPVHKLRTYLVEDSPLIRETLIATLEELGPVEVVGSAEDESTAVQWLRQENNRVDLVIIDIFLKSGSGMGVLRSARRLPGTGKLVVLSNYATPDMRRKCVELGADKVFDKSNDIEALISYCSRLARGEDGSGPATPA